MGQQARSTSWLSAGKVTPWAPRRYSTPTAVAGENWKTPPCSSPLPAADHSIDEHQRPRRLRMGEGEVEGDLSPEGQPDDRRWLHAEGGEERLQVVRVAVRSLGRRGSPEAAQVVAEDAVALGEGDELVVPHARVEREAVDEDQRVARAGDRRSYIRRVDLDELRRPVPRQRRRKAEDQVKQDNG